MEPRQSLPFFHPTTVLYVDDDRHLLSILPLRVGVSPYRCFHDPHDAIDRLERGEILTSLELECWNRYTGEIGDPDSEGVLGLDKWTLYMRLFEPRRFDLASVAVIDYAMPEMSGLTLCRHLSAWPCKRILLTGQADPSLAVQAFNDGLIDMYLSKDDPDLPTQLAEAVRRLQYRYFLDTSRAMREFLLRDDCALWGDEIFSHLLARHCADCGIVEYYAVNDPPGFLLVTAEGSGYLWLVLTEPQIEAQCLTARQLGAPASVLARLEGRSAAIFVGDPEGMTVLSPTQWQGACLPISPIPGRPGRYYGITSRPDPIRLSPRAMLSYARYLENADWLTRQSERRGTD